MYCLFNPTRFQILDIPYGTKEEMEAKLREVKLNYPNEDLIVMEVA